MGKKAWVNGKIYLEREQFCEAVLVEAGIIAKVGTTKEILEAAGEGAEVLSLEGKTMVPGFNDSHLHLLMLGEYLSYADLKGSQSIDEIVQRMKDYIARYPERCKAGARGSGWMEDIFTSGEKRRLIRQDLDRVSTEMPVYVTRADGHVASANTVLVEMAKAKNPELWDKLLAAGLIELDEKGEPTGFFREKGKSVCDACFPKATPEDYAMFLKEATTYAASVGLTSVQSNDLCTPVGPLDLSFQGIQKYFAKEESPIRYTLQWCFPAADELKEVLEKGTYKEEGASMTNPKFKFGPLKLVLDGSLGGRTALMQEEYLDQPGNTGVLNLPAEEVEKFCKIANEHNISVAIHCIGDGAAQIALDAFAAADGTHTNPMRNSIVHCQVTTKEQVQRIIDDNISIMAQPIFLDNDMHQMITRVKEEKCATSYAFGTMHRAGAHVSYGTDCPVEDCSPFPGLYCAITRKDRAGWPEGSWYADECVDIYDAVDCYTRESAWAEFEEAKKGRIQPGFLADFTVCSKDIFTCPVQDLLTTVADMTVVGGEIVYQREN